MYQMRNKVSAIVLFLFSILYLILTIKLPKYELVPVDADVVPLVLGITLLILSIMLFFIKSTEADEEKQIPIIPEKKEDFIMILVVAILIFLYIFLLERLGFVLTTILFLFVTTLSLGYKKHISNVIVSIVVPTVFYIVFDMLLDISLPSGILPF